MIFGLKHFLVILTVQECFCYRPLPISATEGEIWPKPKSIKRSETVLEIAGTLKWKFIPSQRMTSSEEDCPIIDKCAKRHWRFLEQQAVGKYHTPVHPVVESVVIKVERGCDNDAYPELHMDESYQISVNHPEIVIRSYEVWGAIRAIETLSQLIYPCPDHIRLLINSGSVEDSPRYPYRGFMIDTSRHYITMQVILKQLDAMEAVKLNVLHWHIMDDHSFPYVSSKYPNLSRYGAYNRYSHVYTDKDISAVIEEARLRGIRVIPELDIPGHTRSWRSGHPELFNNCSEKLWSEPHGPMLDIDSHQTLNFVQNLITELSSIFKDHTFHLGGDEYLLKCVKRNRASAVNFMEDLGKIIENLPGIKRTSMFWQDVLEMGGQVPKTSIINIWKSWQDHSAQIRDAIEKQNISLIISHPWYLDHMSEGEKWRKNYDVEMFKFLRDATTRSRVIGGQACLWTEYVDSTNFLQWAWPDAAGTAENLWSWNIGSSNTKGTEERLNELRCRLVSRGIPARPIMAGFCHKEWVY